MQSMSAHFGFVHVHNYIIYVYMINDVCYITKACRCSLFKFVNH